MVGQASQVPAPIGAQGHPRGVVELGHHVDQRRSEAAGQSVGEDVDPETVAVGRDPRQVGPGQAEDLESADVARVGQGDLRRRG